MTKGEGKSCFQDSVLRIIKMTVATYRELFHCLAFPVFAVSAKNVLIYKNPACETYLPKIYKCRTVKNKIYPELPKKSAVVRIISGTAYSVAIALQDEETMVFLCFSRFQYADGLMVANALLNKFGASLLEFLSEFRKHLSLTVGNNFIEGFDNEKLFDLVQDEIHVLENKNCALADLLDFVFSKLKELVSTCGYHLEAKIDDAFPRYLPVRISPGDVLFLISKLIYLTIKYSADKRMEFALFPDFAYSRLGLRLMTRTDLKELPNAHENIAQQLEKLLPECATEIELLHKMGLLQESGISIYMDSFGMMSISCHFPYADPGSAVVHSMDDIVLLFSENIGIMIENILEKIKDKDASC